MKTLRGFTLIELLVVIVIIGIVATFALLAFGDFGQSRRITASVEQFNNIMHLAKQQAILTPEVLGARVDEEGYAFYRFVNHTKNKPAFWQVLSSDPLFRYRAFPAGIKLSINIPAKPNTPQLIITPTGNITPFQVTVGDKAKHNLVTLTGQYNGILQLKK